MNGFFRGYVEDYVVRLQVLASRGYKTRPAIEIGGYNLSHWYPHDWKLSIYQVSLQLLLNRNTEKGTYLEEALKLESMAGLSL